MAVAFLSYNALTNSAIEKSCSFLKKILIARTQQSIVKSDYSNTSTGRFPRRSLMRMTTTLLLGAALAAIAMPASASAKMVKQCKDLGIAEIKNCASCHTDKKPTKTDPNQVGKRLIAQKEARKAADYDMAWLKEYFAGKK
jgi:hypothetical protein